ncbi:MAG: hypothetical protein LBT53_06530 [Puniceicoccales bacterium]|jgi:hypothetical protein|nr:hypothetical protein [Puniceicoccales bacterium]
MEEDLPDIRLHLALLPQGKPVALAIRRAACSSSPRSTPLSPLATKSNVLIVPQDELQPFCQNALLDA